LPAAIGKVQTDITQLSERMMLMQNITLIAPACTCCRESQPLVPRDDLAENLAACPATGALYRPDGAFYVRTALPNLTGVYNPPQAVRIDLSQAGYA
jgi:hypothetical protein